MYIHVYKKNEIIIKGGSELIWLWIVIDSEPNNILVKSISKEREIYLWQPSDFFQML
jgi:hypothetical protein